MNQEINVLALVKGKERYIFLFDDAPRNRTRLFRTLRRFASSSDLSFTWYDAATLGQKIRQSYLPVGGNEGEDHDGDDCDICESGSGQTASFTVRRDPHANSSEPMDFEDDDFPTGWWD